MKYLQHRRRLLFGRQGMVRSVTSYGDKLSSDIGSSIKTRRRGEGDAIEEVLRRFDCVDLIPTGGLAFEEIDGAQTFELRAGDEIEWCNGVDLDPSRATSTIGNFLCRSLSELDFPETTEEEEDGFRVVEILRIASRLKVEGF